MRTLLTKFLRQPRVVPVVRAPLNMVKLEDRSVPAVFTFSGIAFDTDNTPSTYTKLAPGTYDGAVVTAEPNSPIVAAVAFPNENGFPGNLSIGSNVFGGTDVKALNLPAGDNGAAQRSGISINYTNGRAIANAAGDEFLIYESASNAAAIEAFMMQAYNVNTGLWTKWVYQPPEAFQKYVGDPTQGAFATKFDLSDFGIGAGEYVTKFRLVNMQPVDRTESASGIGFVSPNNTNPNFANNLPNAGPLGGNLPLNSPTDFDPDPLYSGALGAVAQNIANVRTTVTAVPTPGVGGTQLTYTVTIENLGSLDVTGVDPTFTLDTDFIPTSTTSVASMANGNTNIPNNDTLAILAGGSVTYTIVGTVAPNAPSPVVSTFEAGLPAAPAIDPNLADNKATSTVPITQSGNLVVTITPDSGDAPAGAPITYTITVTNTGPSGLTGAGITDVIPPGLVGVTFTSTATGGSGNTPNGSGAINDIVNLDANGKIVYTVTGTIPANFTGNIPFSASTTLPPSATGTAGSQTVNTNAVAQGDLFVTMTSSPATTIGGQNVTYVITAGNKGPSVATASLLTDNFSSAFTSISYTSTNTAGASGNKTNGIGNLNEAITFQPGSSVTYTVTATLAPNVVGPVTNTAMLMAPPNFTETNPGDNSASTTVTVTPGADVGLVVTPNTPIVSLGSKMSYTVEVTNNGPSASVGVNAASLLDPNISNITFTSIASNGASGNTTTGFGNYNDILTLPQGGKVTYTIFGQVNVGISGNLTSTFTSNGNIPDPNPGDNKVTIVTPTQPSPDVIYAASTGLGVTTQVFVFNADGSARFSYQPYQTSFTRGVNVAIGDVNGDGFPDVITGAASGGGSHVRAVNGFDGTNLFSFFAYGSVVRTGVVVAAEDLNGDGIAEIITGSDKGGGPRVRVFDITKGGASGVSILDFFAYDNSGLTLTSGIRVAAGNTSGSKVPEIVVSTGPNGSPFVRTFNGVTGAFISQFQPFGASSRGSFVATADFNNDGFASIVVGDGAGASPAVRVFDPTANFAQTTEFLTYESNFKGGVRVATYADDSISIATPPNRILAGPGVTGGPRLRTFTGEGLDLGSQFLIGAFERGGIYVG